MSTVAAAETFTATGESGPDDSGTGFATVIHDDAVTALRRLPDSVFNVALTSPPYYWARDYGFDGQLGHEDTVEGYVAALMEAFDEVRRVLHPEGVFFLNIGDTYYSGNGQPHGHDPKCATRNFLRKKKRPVDTGGWDIPKKSLLGIPWTVAKEMQSRGWTLRSAIVWNRRNAFVEPTARDRPYRQYEFVFMFSRSRFYSFDRSALVEEDVWNIPIERKRVAGHNAMFPDELARRCILAGSPPGGHVLDPFVGSGTTISVALRHGRNGGRNRPRLRIYRLHHSTPAGGSISVRDRCREGYFRAIHGVEFLGWKSGAV